MTKRKFKNPITLNRDVELNIYVTGLTSALIAAINAARTFINIKNIVVWHYDRNADTYKPQKVMNILTLRKLRRLIQKTNLTHDTPYTETPMYAVEMLIYLALYQHDHPIYSDELQRAVGCKIDKVLCTARDHLRDYITYTLATRPNIRHPVKQFRLTPKGISYVDNLVKELEA